MMHIYSRDVAALCLTVAVMILECSADRVDLSQLLGHRNFRYGMPSQKRVKPGGNPCTKADQPWPCRTTGMCLPMGYICDENFDCLDNSDEDPDMCTARMRPPVEDIQSFLSSQERWVMPSLFDNKNLGKVADALAVSKNIDDFRRRIGMSSKASKRLRQALRYIKEGNEDAMAEKYRMPKSAWNEVSFFFARLNKGGFE